MVWFGSESPCFLRYRPPAAQRVREASPGRRAYGCESTHFSRLACVPLPHGAPCIEPPMNDQSATARGSGRASAEEARRVEREAKAGQATVASLFTHELGNIANNIHLQGQLLDRKLGHPPIDGERATTSMLRDGRRLSEFVAKLRGAEASQRAGATFVSLEDVARYATRRVGPLAQASGVRVRFQATASECGVRGQVASLDYLVVELCSNAIQAMPDGGRLDLRLVALPSEVRLSVVDTGPGLPQDIDVFAAFSTSRAGRSGLGLAIVRHIAVEHRGTVTATRSPPSGSTFVLTLPLSEPPRAE